MSSDCILIERDGAIGWVTLNRPERLNAFNLAMWKALPARLKELEDDPAIRVIILRGAGEKAFGAGADITEFEANRRDPATASEYSDSNDEAFLAIRNCTKPTIAMVHGFCIGGGCAVALCADIRIAAEDAKFAITPGRLGLGYSFTGIEHVVQELGPANARYLFLTAQQLPAAKALELGVVQEVHAPGELRERTIALAKTIAANAPKTLRAVKESVRQSQIAPSSRNRAAVEGLIAACFESRDYQEGLKAFAEKRAPVFRDE